jgi:hypothetical protein
MEERFEKYFSEFLQFDKVKNKRSKRKDIHAFIMLDEWFNGDGDIIGSAEHDKIWLSIDEEDVLSLTDEQIIELQRCGISFDSEYECLYSFV